MYVSVVCACVCISWSVYVYVCMSLFVDCVIACMWRSDNDIWELVLTYIVWHQLSCSPLQTTGEPTWALLGLPSSLPPLWLLSENMLLTQVLSLQTQTSKHCLTGKHFILWANSSACPRNRLFLLRRKILWIFCFSNNILYSFQIKKVYRMQGLCLHFPESEGTSASKCASVLEDRWRKPGLAFRGSDF